MTAEKAAELYGAQMYLPKGGDTDIAMLYYRWHTSVLNTGEFATRLQYLSHCNTWQNSFDRDREKLVAKLVQIPGVPAHDPEAAAKAIAAEELQRWGRDEYDRIQALRATYKEQEDRREAVRR